MKKCAAMVGPAAQVEFAWERVAEKTLALSRKMTRSDTT